ncbi:unnamed protein product [Rotaria socialis]|uniref:Uncharacterized protein n=1 Tax=Rotaria socialis TaxID=392032 RepID=A0A818YB03_9BILA|nr:unnamed protein product [Rotaria socialis]CAF4542812.1 unnamed protein product [Rotaria socialis]
MAQLRLGQEQFRKTYASFVEQYLIAGVPYIRDLYCPINECRNGIRRLELVKLIRCTAKLITNGFQVPVNPTENLAPDGQVFVEILEKDQQLCERVITTSPDVHFDCIQICIEDFVHEQRQWQAEVFLINNRRIICAFNHTLVHELRKNYGIDHFDEKTNRSALLKENFYFVHCILR